MSETLQTIGDRCLVRIERRYPFPPEKLWRVITEPEQLSQWFPTAVQFDLEVGADTRFDHGDGCGPIRGGSVTEIDPVRRFAFSWNGELLRWELARDGDGCVMTFSHTFNDQRRAASVRSGWAGCLDVLGKLLHDRR